MLTRLRLLPPVLLVTLLGPATGSAETVSDFAVWGAATAQGSFAFASPKAEKVRWWLEGQARFHDDASRIDQAFVRPGLGYTVAPRTTVWAGYGWFRNFPDSDPEFDEHRIWQQLTWSKPLASFGLHSRTRLEQRLLDTGDDTGWRLRQWVRLVWPAESRISLAAYDELFFALNDTDWGARAGLDRNRFFAGAGVDVDPHRHVRFEVGYLNQFVNKVGDDEIDHILSLSLTLNY